VARGLKPILILLFSRCRLSAASERACRLDAQRAMDSSFAADRSAAKGCVRTKMVSTASVERTPIR
jgi:hypothetical protein